MSKPYFEKYSDGFDAFLDLDQEIVELASGFKWTEGPVWIEGSLYFNDIPNKRMMQWNAENGLSIALENSEFANGNTLDKNGFMVSCEHGGRRVVRRQNNHGLDGIEIIASHYEGKRLNSPNDVVVKSDGSVWFTDPPYGINSDIEGYPAEPELDGCFVFCAKPDGTLIAVAKDFDKPNGLAFNLNESKLYIADSGAIKGASFPGIDYDLPHHIRVFDVEGHHLKNGKIFKVIEPGVPDGFRVDNEDCIWTSALDGIHCLDKNGKILGKICLPQQTSNCCFGGADGTSLFITSSDKVYRVETKRCDAASCK